MQKNTVFVTGATGLLGNNLVRQLLVQGYKVKALVRSVSKAQKQFQGLAGIEFVVGDMARVADFTLALQGCKVIFHTAAFFRDSYKGGSHQTELMQTNVSCTTQLLEAVYAQGVRCFVHTSSIAVLGGKRGEILDESCARVLPERVGRPAAELDDYYRSKVLSDEAVQNFMASHSDMHVAFILPGWMWGPGDMGPTSAGQLLLQVVQQKLPGCMHGSFSLVDARDVVQVALAAARKMLLAGDDWANGSRYLVAGRYITMYDLVQLIGQCTGVKVPGHVFPYWAVYGLAVLQEVYHRITGRPVLMSLAVVKLMQQENGKTHFSSEKAIKELGATFRPMEETMNDTWAWFKDYSDALKA